MRKMVKNRWLLACLFLGCLLSVALFSSLPAYTRGVLQRMIQKEFEARQVSQNVQPLRYEVRRTIKAEDARPEALAAGESRVEEMYAQLELPALERQTVYNYTGLTFVHVALEGGEESSKSLRAGLAAATGFEDHVQLVAGRFPAGEKTAGEYEVMVSEQTMRDAGLMLGSRYRATQLKDAEGSHVRFRLVGVFRVADTADQYWFSGIDTAGLRMSAEGFVNMLADGNSVISVQKSWFFPLDYTRLQVENADAFYETVLRQQDEKVPNQRVILRGDDILGTYFAKRDVS